LRPCAAPKDYILKREAASAELARVDEVYPRLLDEGEALLG